ncbi:F0F1 ATP synthase subunit A [Brevibacterium album]|uniref:F0F1 ATP synthase subunit A n=1 Tax=Brevibacterium album TaxID=417948 RepID=UPI00041B021C|nr:F0F1 ATP synthase subunit A [Brevibacterium album]
MSLLAAGGGDGFHAPGLEEFYPPSFLFVGTPFEINRMMLLRIAATIVLILIFWLGLRKARIVPTRFQSLIEMALDFVRRDIAYGMLGKKDGDRFFPLLAALFFGILFLNITKVIPFLNISSNANIGMPLVMALVVYVVMIGAGIKAQGGGAYIKSQLFPAGVPKPMYLLVTPIEFVSTFIARPVSLTLRLMFNMLVGHLLLVLCFAATQFFFVDMGGLMGGFGILTLLGGLFFMLFEAMVSILQAYVFALLTAAYIQLSVSQDH